MKQYDCVIVGGGAVGMSLALALGQCHTKTLLIEQKAPNVDSAKLDGRTIALSHASHRIYALLGIWEQIKQPIPIDQVLVTVKGHYGSSRLKSHDRAISSLGYVVGLQALEKVLDKALFSQSDVDVLRPATVIKREATPDAWHITVAGDKEEMISCKLLIAADGLASVLRQEQQIACQHTNYEHYAVMTNIELEHGHHNIAHERFLKEGAIALLPWRDNLMTCVWTTHQAQAQALIQLEDQDFLKACQAEIGNRIGKLKACNKRISLPLQMQVAALQTSARFLLMGNAAHSLHPIAAQGLNLSLRDIWQIRSQILKAKDPCDIGSPSFLQDYLQARQPDQERVIFATDKIARYMSGGPLPSWLRALGLTLFDSLAPLKHKFTTLGMGT